MFCSLDKHLTDQEMVRFLRAFFRVSNVGRWAPSAYYEIRDGRRRFQALSRVVQVTSERAFCDYTRRRFPVAPPEFELIGVPGVEAAIPTPSPSPRLWVVPDPGL